MGLPVLPDAVRLCWGCQQDMLTMRRHIGHVCKRRMGEDTILTDSVQLPAPCVSQSCSPIVLRETEKSKKRKRESLASHVSAPQTEVPVHKVVKTLFHVDVNTKASQTDAMHARCTVRDTIRMLLGQLQAIHDCNYEANPRYCTFPNSWSTPCREHSTCSYFCTVLLLLLVHET